jgi:hypothetical protein
VRRVKATVVVLYSDSARIGSGRAGACGCLASRRRFFRRTDGASHTRASGAEGGAWTTLASDLRIERALPSAWLLLWFRLSHPSKVRRGDSFPRAEFLARWSFTRFAVYYPVSSPSWDFIDLRFACIWVISWEI